MLSIFFVYHFLNVLINIKQKPRAFMSNFEENIFSFFILIWIFVLILFLKIYANWTKKQEILKPLFKILKKKHIFLLTDWYFSGFNIFGTMTYLSCFYSLACRGPPRHQGRIWHLRGGGQRRQLHPYPPPPPPPF